MRRSGVAVLAAGMLLTAACTGGGSSAPAAQPSARPSASSSATSPAPTSPQPTSTAPSPPATSGTRQSQPPSFSRDRAYATVRHLAGTIGPRLATGPRFHRAARWVAARFAELGYDVSRQAFAVPAGESWGVPVEAGTSTNVVATLPGFDPGRPYRLVGAHLDTVAVAPGAEDNASGIAVLLETARRWAAVPGVVPVVFVAFGGEEPRGTGEDQHHFGSRHYVARMSPAERRQLRGMVALDRVGVGRAVPVGLVAGSDPFVADALLARARHERLPFVRDPDNAASDHESFADEGMPAARLGSTPYAAYHSAADRPDVVSPDQLGRVGLVLWGWLTSPDQPSPQQSVPGR